MFNTVIMPLLNSERKHFCCFPASTCPPLRLEIQPVFCAINHGNCEYRAICDPNVNDIIKRSVVKVKRCERPSDLEFSGHSLRVGAAQDLPSRSYDLAAIMRAGGWSDPSTVSRYLRFSQHNIWSENH